MPCCELSHARRLFSGPAFPGYLPCLAAVRLRLDNLFIKQSTVDLRELCVSGMKGVLRKRGAEGVRCLRQTWRGAGRGARAGLAWAARGLRGSFMIVASFGLYLRFLATITGEAARRLGRGTGRGR